MAVDLKYMDEMLAEMLYNLPDSPINKCSQNMCVTRHPDIEIDEQKLSGFTDKLFEHFGVLAPFVNSKEANFFAQLVLLGCSHIKYPDNKYPAGDYALNVFFTLTFRFLSHSGLNEDSMSLFSVLDFNDIRSAEYSQRGKIPLCNQICDYVFRGIYPCFSDEIKTKKYRGTCSFKELKKALVKHGDDELIKKLLTKIEDLEKRKMEAAANDPNNEPTDEMVDFIINDPEIKRLFSEIRKKAKENDIYKEINDIIKELPTVINVLGEYLHDNNLIVLYVKSILNVYADKILIEVVKELCKKLKKYPKDKKADPDEFEKICIDSQSDEDAVKKILSSELKLEDLVEQHQDICGVIAAKFYSIVFVHEFIHHYHYRIGICYDPNRVNGLYAYEIIMGRFFEKKYPLCSSRNAFSSKMGSPDNELLCESLAQYFEILYMKYIGEYSLAESTAEDLENSSVLFPYRGALVFYEKQPDPVLDNQTIEKIDKYDFAKKYITDPDTNSFKDEYEKFNKKSAT